VPAAAVIPAPIAYAKVVAVKKLVVGSRARWRTERPETKVEGRDCVAQQCLGNGPPGWRVPAPLAPSGGGKGGRGSNRGLTRSATN
jgi:hypothetical protein